MKLWNPEATIDKRIEGYTVGNDYELDQVLIPYDCQASIAHAKMLGKIGILAENEVSDLTGELENIIRLVAQGKFVISPGDEDCHTAIENHLTETLGDAGKKIHTARSRNDQVATALRLYYLDMLEHIRGQVLSLQNSLKSFIGKYGAIEFPGYTHTRKAMPSSIDLWAGWLSDSMDDNLVLLASVQRILDQSPLGSGAGYGVPLPVDRDFTANELDFERVQNNPVYVQGSRGKFEMLILQFCSQIMLDLNRVATDIILFSEQGFGYLNLPGELCTGSSIMPQKQNPDVFEIMRAKYHQVAASEQQVASTIANLISGYHRDLQLTKEPVMTGLQITEESLAVLAYAFEKILVDEQACKAAMTEELFATQEAYKLVEQGVPFRDAYRQVAKKYRKT